MRWGDWYVHDALHVKNVRTGLIASMQDLYTPATVAAFCEQHHVKLVAIDVVALLTCANELVWCAFDFDGIGDWIDADGAQRGRQEHRSAAI